MAFTFRADGWFNMTKAARHFGKKLSHFWESPDTIEYGEAIRQLPEFRGIELTVANRCELPDNLSNKVSRTLVTELTKQGY